MSLRRLANAATPYLFEQARMDFRPPELRFVPTHHRGLCSRTFSAGLLVMVETAQRPEIGVSVIVAWNDVVDVYRGLNAPISVRAQCCALVFVSTQDAGTNDRCPV